MADPRKVLVVDDDQPMRELLVSLLEDGGFDATAVERADRALELLREAEFDVVLSDIRMPGMDGIDLLGEAREVRPETPFLLMTAFGSIDAAVEAMRAGAFDYITKPFKSDAVLAALERACERRALEQENRRLRRAVDRTSSFGDLIGASPAMREIFALIRKVAPSRSNVLITGESGTGKDVVARTIHFTGPRSRAPYIPINCTAMPEGLLESELFGHVRGAFTGAHATKKGLFAEAGEGTLFLDEIADMPLGLQGKLLRVLQDGEIRPVGGNRPVRVDVRVIAATNSDLKQAVDEGRFRKDLYYRLNVIPLHIPPLRERPEDVPPLVDAFLRKYATDRPRTIAPEAMERLKRCAWDGNARELENLIERALALSSNTQLGVDDLPLPGDGDGAESSPAPTSLVETALEQRWTLRQLDDHYTARVLESTGGNKVQAARILGINRRTLYRRGEHSEESEDA